MSEGQLALEGFDVNDWREANCLPRVEDRAHLQRLGRAAEEAAGEVHKALGMARADDVADHAWKDRVDNAIATLASTRDEHGELLRFTAEDVRDLAGDPPDHPNAHGARFSAAARRGLIRKVGYRLASRASLHRHPLALWQGTVRSTGESEEQVS